ncbi:hypothetical protein RF11_10062 [Thelohanellus kitauei]|uniref:Uncharacterized protein n=1 Tax=Thelohanellus kitauei TaxID=669202 RepID=A0A0C2J3X9_THEKT|nr:hypothetical protein RF11_10062 [Thelohanellus kitauei]
MLKFILLALILIEKEVRALNCELEKYDEFEEIVNYFRLRNYALGREFDGHMYPQNSVSEFKQLLEENDARVKYVQNIINSIKRKSADSRESINEDIEQNFQENIEIQKWLQNRFLRFLLQCYAKSEHALHPEQDENVTELKPLPPNPSTDTSKSKFGVVFLSLFAIVFFGSMIIYSTIFLIKPTLIRVPRFFQRQRLELK